MKQWLDNTFDKITDKFIHSAALAAKQDLIPYKSEKDQWIASPYDGNSWWTGGFWPGTMWQLYAATKDERFSAEALRAEKLLVAELMTFNKLNHDVGFMYLLSTGAHDLLLGDEMAHTHTLHAANLLAGRFNPTGFIRAWNDTRSGWAIIDCMMNLCLLYWATAQTGDPRYEKIARIHADTSMREFVREDGSCNHIVIFDPNTGEAIDKPGGQGYAEGSSWSRGQAWALYGFALSHLHTKECKYLATARRIADYFIANIREDGLTDCDFRQPEGEERIDNIAGACAASGLLDIAAILGEDEGKPYKEAAIRMLRAMDDLCADWSQRSPGILQKCTASYHDDGAGRHVNIHYGDYFFVEAICKLRGTAANLWMTSPQGVQ